MNSEVFVLFLMVASGAFLSMAYHMVKAFKKVFSLGNIACSSIDFLCWLAISLCVYYMLFVSNDGILRGYEFCGLFLGSVLYFFTIGKWFFLCFEWIFKNILKIFDFILKILLTPMRFFDKILVYKLFKKFGGADNNAEKEKTGQKPVSKSK